MLAGIFLSIYLDVLGGAPDKPGHQGNYIGKSMTIPKRPASKSSI